MKITNYSNDFYTNIDIMVYNNGYEECEPNHFYGPTLRKSYMIHYVSSGKGIFKVDNNIYHLKKGDAFLIKPGQLIYYQADHDDPWSYGWIGMLGIKVDYYLKQTAFESSPVIHYDKDDQLTLLYIKMENAYRSLGDCRELLINSVLYELLHFLTNNFPNNQIDNQKHGKRYIQEIVSYVTTNIQEKVRVDEIANLFGLDRSYLTRLFKQEVGMSLKNYILSTKLDEAKNLLSNTELPINVISRSIGIDDPLYFSRIFKEKEKMSAKEYRNNNSNK
ncbi:MAG: AraC family ligand binding domain-containing protein [Thomasclavelia sp.]|nr:AraC family ligand binding domain-containing protein [Thomasclavelia sp.]